MTTDSEAIQEDLEYLHMGNGPNYVFYRSYHMPTIEPLLSAARAGLGGNAALVPKTPVVDTIAMAKKDLFPGDEIDGIGGRTVSGLAERAEVAKDQDLVPISLAEGATVQRSIQKGDPVHYDDVELRDSELLHLRKLQDSYFNLNR